MSRSLLTVRHLDLQAPGGRTLLRDLSLTLEVGERVALVGRNGVGKSSLLEALSGASVRDEVRCRGERRLVPQHLEPASGVGESPGESRRRRLEAVRLAAPELLLLDEPSRDLDQANIDWLEAWLSRWRQGLVVASHDRRLLRLFDEFFVIAEAGCHHFSGSYEELVLDLKRRHDENEQRYVRSLGRLLAKERRDDKVRRRRERKKNLGRLHELGRCTSRAALNTKRGYAQKSQGKRAVLQEQRIGAAREWARATRRALSVELGLRLTQPALPADTPFPIAELTRVTAQRGARMLFEDISLRLGRERVALVGPNASGKTTLLEILLGFREADEGCATRVPKRIGYVAQSASNWSLERNLLEHLLVTTEASLDEIAQALRAHEFPFALAERALASLSPGERSRAALIALCQRRPVPELLVLDEPTQNLDLLGRGALETFLSAWPGGLLVVSHDDEFLEAIGIEGRLELQ